MVFSSMHASSLFKNSNKRRKISSLDSLPDDLLVEISSRTAASSLSKLCNLRLVSKKFQRTCDEKYVISRLSLHELTLNWPENPINLFNFYERCRINGNPEALYRQGIINYFRSNQKEEGLEDLSEAAQKGNKEAIYVYGLILICGGGRIIDEGPVLHGDETKQEGFKILSSLIKPLMSETLEDMVEMRKKIRSSLTWVGRPMMIELKRAYVRYKCECDGRTGTFIARNGAWFRYGKDNDMNTSSACEFCLWNHEVKRLFDGIE